jgi:hypothetical protein
MCRPGAKAEGKIKQSCHGGSKYGYAKRFRGANQDPQSAKSSSSPRSATRKAVPTLIDRDEWPVFRPRMGKRTRSSGGAHASLRNALLSRIRGAGRAPCAVAKRGPASRSAAGPDASRGYQGPHRPADGDWGQGRVTAPGLHPARWDREGRIPGRPVRRQRARAVGGLRAAPHRRAAPVPAHRFTRRCGRVRPHRLRAAPDCRRPEISEGMWPNKSEALWPPISEERWPRESEPI